jgi:hypothetical protein
MKPALLTVCASLFLFYLLTTKTQAACADTWAQQNMSLSATCGNYPNAGTRLARKVVFTTKLILLCHLCGSL